MLQAFRQSSEPDGYVPKKKNQRVDNTVQRVLRQNIGMTLALTPALPERQHDTQIPLVERLRTHLHSDTLVSILGIWRHFFSLPFIQAPCDFM